MSNPQEIIHQLADLELSIGKLYWAFAQLFPQDATFWEELHHEEQAHARILTGLLPRLEQGKVRFAPERFNLMGIRLMCRSLDEELARIHLHSTTRIAALTLAVSVENSLLEKNFLAVAEGDSPGFQKALHVLDESTKQHRQMLQDRLREARG